MDKIICVGKNYSEHSAELGDVHPEKPVLFIKPPSVLRTVSANGSLLNLKLPRHSEQVHHEVELVFRIDRDGFRMTRAEAEKALGAVTVGLDMTLRDIQQECKRKGTPWTTGKVFPDAAVIGPWIELQAGSKALEEVFSFALDGVQRQSAQGKQMSHDPFECLSYVSQFFPICKGDLIFTGTPVGVGPVALGQTGEVRYGPIHYKVTWSELV